MDSSLLEVAVGLGGTCVGFLINEIFKNNKKDLKDLKQSIDKCIETVTKNTIISEVLAVRIDNVDKKLDEVGELRRDVDRLGANIRSERNN